MPGKRNRIEGYRRRGVRVSEDGENKVWEGSTHEKDINEKEDNDYNSAEKEEEKGEQGDREQEQVREEDMDEEKSNEVAKEVGGFDDEIPKELPTGWRVCESYEGPGRPKWVVNAIQVATEFGTDGLSVRNISRLLNFIHIPDYRAHEILKNDELEMNHACVMTWAGNNYFRSNQNELEVASLTGTN